jgi:predicted  nucleic acid-binding Zn-ribbon protein
MGGRTYVQRAKDFLDAASNMKGAHELQRQLDAANDQIATLKAAIERLQAEVAANPKRRRAVQEEDLTQ